VALARKYRITSDKDFDRAFRFGEVLSGQGVVLKIVSNNVGRTRFGVAVSAKKFPLAVTRNKVKRAMFLEVAKVVKDFKIACDVVLVAQLGYDKKGGELGVLITKALNAIKSDR